jgi:hypothetical protein
MSEYRLTSSLHNVILCGIREGWGQKKTLEVYRNLGGEIRDTDFHRIYRESWEQIEEWARSKQQQ